MKNQPLQKTIVPNITKRKYIKKAVVESIETKPEIIVSTDNVIENENDNDIQHKRINNLIKARDARQEKLNNKQSDKEDKINELVDAINKDQIEKIIIKSNKLKSKLLKLI
jgi:hypothetical protein